MIIFRNISTLLTMFWMALHAPMTIPATFVSRANVSMLAVTRFSTLPFKRISVASVLEMGQNVQARLHLVQIYMSLSINSIKVSKSFDLFNHDN